MNRFDELHIYIEVVQKRGFSKAANSLGLSKQLVSRQVAQLEARLGVRLLNRTTRHLSVTELGRDYYQKALSILSDLEEADRAVRSYQSVPKGKLRLTMPVAYGVSYLTPLLAQFMLLYPDLELLIDVNDAKLDLIEQGFDLAIRIAELSDSTLIARQIAPIEHFTVASEAYLQKFGVPRHPEELKNHHCLIYGTQKTATWFYQDENQVLLNTPVKGRFVANNGNVLLNATIQGLGITYLPDFFLKQALEQKLIRSVLSDFEMKKTKIYAVYPRHKQSNIAVKSLIEFLILNLSPSYSI